MIQLWFNYKTNDKRIDTNFLNLHKYNFLKRLRITNLVSKVKLQTKGKNRIGLENRRRTSGNRSDSRLIKRDHRAMLRMFRPMVNLAAHWTQRLLSYRYRGMFRGNPVNAVNLDAMPLIFCTDCLFPLHLAGSVVVLRTNLIVPRIRLRFCCTVTRDIDLFSQTKMKNRCRAFITLKK